MDTIKNQPVPKAKKTKRRTILLVISLVINIIFFICTIFGLIFINFTKTDINGKKLIIDMGLKEFCSEQYKDMVQEQYKGNEDYTEDGLKRRIAYLDYTCVQDGAEDFHYEGFENYLKSLGIPLPTEDESI